MRFAQEMNSLGVLLHAVRCHHVNRETTIVKRTARSYFRFSPPPTPETGDRTASKQFPTPGPEGLVLFLGAARGWIVLGKIEPWIINTLRS